MRHRRGQILFISLWAAVSILAASVLTSFHQPYALPSKDISSLATSQHRWRALHLLAADCGCSQKVSQHLATRAPLTDVSEEVVFIGADDPFGNRSPLLARGFHVKAIRPKELQPFGLKGAPLLVFISPEGQIAYMGGYGAGSYQDSSIWNQLRSGAAVAPLPVIGCAVGRGLQRQTDPFSWKYADERKD